MTHLLFVCVRVCIICTLSAPPCRCRLTLLQVHPISATSLQEGLVQQEDEGKGTSSSGDQKQPQVEVQQVNDLTAGKGSGSGKGRGKDRRGGQGGGVADQLPLHSFFPLFRLAGDSQPGAVVPLELDVAVQRTLQRLSLKKGGEGAASSKAVRQAEQLVLSLFECVGVVLGFSIRNSCPMGLGEPCPFCFSSDVLLQLCCHFFIL